MPDMPTIDDLTDFYRAGLREGMRAGIETVHSCSAGDLDEDLDLLQECIDEGLI